METNVGKIIVFLSKHNVGQDSGFDKPRFLRRKKINSVFRQISVQYMKGIVEHHCSLLSFSGSFVIGMSSV